MSSELYKVQQEANRLSREIRDARAKLWLTRTQGCATIDKLLWEQTNLSYCIKDALEELDRIRNECQMKRSEITKKGARTRICLIQVPKTTPSFQWLQLRLTIFSQP
ncbi:unnamed protein product [Nippostrongylus brasiliensis]|uniref:Tektin n=1 Tax=Nippostrongylus brasiliensis TaxID=27835 RepID=A0A0N4XYC6_NIPBR|nr:unnamed protein product [Nippostrongylus brasiliensis]